MLGIICTFLLNLKPFTQKPDDVMIVAFEHLLISFTYTTVF